MDDAAASGRKQEVGHVEPRPKRQDDQERGDEQRQVATRTPSDGNSCTRREAHEAGKDVNCGGSGKREADQRNQQAAEKGQNRQGKYVEADIVAQDWIGNAKRDGIHEF